MKLLITFAIAICGLTTSAAQAQKKNSSSNSSTKSRSTVLTDTSTTAEGKKNQYKSKQWRQGIVTPEETKSGEKPKSEIGTKPRKSRKTPAAPAPLQAPNGLPPAGK